MDFLTIAVCTENVKRGGKHLTLSKKKKTHKHPFLSSYTDENVFLILEQGDSQWKIIAHSGA